MSSRSAERGRGGPKTAAGRARSSRNAVTHGLACEHVLDDEEKAAVDAAVAQILAEVPRTVDHAAVWEWVNLRLELRRIARAKAEALACAPIRAGKIAAVAHESRLLHRLGALRGDTTSIERFGRMPKFDPRGREAVEADELGQAIETLARIARYEARLRGRLAMLQKTIWNVQEALLSRRSLRPRREGQI